MSRAAAAAALRPRVIFSGIQPTGVPHLGNYAGALRQWVRLQAQEPEARLIYSIVDLHAITVAQDPVLLRRRKRETLAVLLAIGVDPDRCTLFHQSAVRSVLVPLTSRTRDHPKSSDDHEQPVADFVQVPAHAELMWILSCTASIGYLSRMTQWKVIRLLRPR